MSSGEEQTYEDAKRIAIRWITHIAMLETTEKVVIVGSLRRKQLKINDIDIQVIGSHYDIENLFWAKGVGLESGDTKRQIYTLKSGVKLNVFYTTQLAWGASLMHNTGSKTYNIRKRLRSQAEGYKLNQYGVWDECGMKVKDGIWDSEQKIYDFFGWTYCKPEDRK
tara:strand:- start:108 stop:605 length:498 start_codon:yes stop_codon:yes gene_type:complete